MWCEDRVSLIRWVKQNPSNVPPDALAPRPSYLGGYTGSKEEVTRAVTRSSEPNAPVHFSHARSATQQLGVPLRGASATRTEFAPRPLERDVPPPAPQSFRQGAYYCLAQRKLAKLEGGLHPCTESKEHTPPDIHGRRTPHTKRGRRAAAGGGLPRGKAASEVPLPCGRFHHSQA